MGPPQLDRIPDLWGLGWFVNDRGESVPYPATRHEMSERLEFAQSLLRGHGVVADDVVVFVARSRDAVQVASWEEAANTLGAAFCVVDGYRTDAHRLAAYVRLFSPRAVLGIVDDVVEGLLTAGDDPVSLLSSIPVIAARPKARARLAALELPTRLWQHLGPAVAVDCYLAQGAHLEPMWNPAIVDGRITLRPAEGLAIGTTHIDTGWLGDVLERPCLCGTPGPRIVVSGHPASSGDTLPDD
jgi:hypothetical protein